MATKTKSKNTKIANMQAVHGNLLGLVEFLLNIDANVLTPLNITSMSDNNGGRIMY
jgi:hypothetical protein